MTELTLNLKEKDAILFCFDHLQHVVTVARKKFDMETASNADRQKWARIVVAAIEAYAKLIETREVNEILGEIEEARVVKGFE